MFSVPESIEILAPEETANHSSGTPSRSARSSAAMIRRHSGSASDPRFLLGSLASTTRVIPSGYSTVKLRTTPTTRLAVFSPYGRSTGTRRSPSRSCSVKSPGGKPERAWPPAEVSVRISS